MFNISNKHKLKVEPRKEYKKGKLNHGTTNTKYVLYVVETYELFELANRKKYMVMVWSILDQRYILTVYTNHPETTLDEVKKKYKMKYSRVLDLRGKTKKEVIEYYRVRIYG